MTGDINKEKLQKLQEVNIFHTTSGWLNDFQNFLLLHHISAFSVSQEHVRLTHFQYVLHDFNTSATLRM